MTTESENQLFQQSDSSDQNQGQQTQDLPPYSNNYLWSTAAIDGLLLSLVSVLIMALTVFVNLPVAVSVLVWLAKLVISGYLLYYFMKKYSASFSSISYSQSLTFGFATSVFSSIICSAFQLLSITVLKPQAIEESFEMAMGQYGSMFEQSGVDLASVMDIIPQVTLIWGFIWYLIIGLVFSLIFANMAKKENIF